MQKVLLTRIAAAVVLMSCGASPIVQAQDARDLSSAVRRALDTNPEVSARLNALRAASEAVSVVKGGRLPRVDLEGEVGRNSDRITGRTPSETQNLNRSGLSLSVSQLLWDGMALSHDITRLDHERTARWFELNAASEEAAGEVGRAWTDVLRMRRMVQLAEDNYVQHRYAYDQIQSRVRAGVGRGVDQEQANARLALAESNLTTEKSNLHDVTERYIRLVGEAPPASMPRVTGLERRVPATSSEAMAAATRGNAVISAAIENLRAAKATASQREAAWQPRVEARARVGGGKNFDGVLDQKRDANVGLYLNWNLYNGGADQARIRQQAAVVNQAADLRDKACRDVRQTAAIAHNDVRKLVEQLALLDRNTLAIEKARDAYRQQFDIGQRSLLDLLNAENEVYTARRAYANAEHDLGLAHVRSLAASGQLITALGLRPAAAGDLAPRAANWSAGEEAASRCPQVGVESAGAARADLDARAKALMVPSASTAAAPAPAAAATALPAVRPAAPAAATAPAASELSDRLRDWAAAWSAKDTDRYFGFYTGDFKPSKGSRDKWQAERRRLVGKPGPIQVDVSSVDVRPLPDGRVVTTFLQDYRSANFKDKSRKSLVWRKQGGQWVIAQEANR